VSRPESHAVRTSRRGDEALLQWSLAAGTLAANGAWIMEHAVSPEDAAFRVAFETGQVPPAQFDHGAHVRLAYVYLVEQDPEAATARMRSALQAFLQHHGIAPTKYHETLTRAWILAVRHFMERSPGLVSAQDLIARHPELLDSKIMLTHYSASLLFSAEARAAFVEPDASPIPRYPK
jgi:hypothetical protein